MGREIIDQSHKKTVREYKTHLKEIEGRIQEVDRLGNVRKRRHTITNGGSRILWRQYLHGICGRSQVLYCIFMCIFYSRTA